MEDEKGFNTTLELSLGVGKSVTIPKREKIKSSMICLDLSFTLRPNQEGVHILDHQLGCPRVLNSMTLEEKEESANNDKRSDHSVNGNNTSCGRKKLRLTKEQSSLLEECFKVHNTLNPVQKQALAEQLNLKPRQVEVWFQNRRARTKLKQTEVDREFLEKCCLSLSDENKRLKKELQELRSTLKLRRSSPINAHVPKAAASLATCPSCEKMDDKSDQKSLPALQLRPGQLFDGWCSPN